MNELRVLVVDDSAYNRRTISELLESMNGVHVVGKAADGDQALQIAADVRPNLITLDLEMPRMDGFTFLRLLMARSPTPVIVISGYSAKENVFRALELGALDFVSKPTRTVTSDLAAIRKELQEKVELVRHLSPARISSLGLKSREATVPRFRLPGADAVDAATKPSRVAKVVLVGASTGGPTALVELFRRLPHKVDAAVLVAQHMPERFTRTFAERLDRLGGMRVREAVNTHALARGQAWICPGGKCMEIGADGQVTVVEPRSDDRYVPSVDRLFESGARKLGARALGVVLTGMGDDGAAGATALKAAGAQVFTEAAESAVIYGMPAAVMRTGAVDASLPIIALAERLAEVLQP